MTEHPNPRPGPTQQPPVNRNNHRHYFAQEPVVASNPVAREVRIMGQAVSVTTDAGVFSRDGLDLGTAVLLRSVLLPPAQGTFVDVGCGWGPITMALALNAPEADVVGVDVNSRALDLTNQNCAAAGLTNVRTCTPDDLDEAFVCDLIWSNPPVRIGKAALQQLVVTWLKRLRPGGTAWWVVQRNLGADSLLTWLAQHSPQHVRTTKHCSAKGFRVLRSQADPMPPGTGDAR